MSNKNSLQKKYTRLKEMLRNLDSAVIAFSGGLDSGFLCKVVYEVLGKNTVAVTALSATYPSLDVIEAKRIAKEIGIKHIIIHTKELENKRFIRNPYNRCYWCKIELFSKLKKIASQRKFSHILDGTNYGDRSDHRPGFLANKKFGVMSPLYECRFTKSDIKALAKTLNLSFWNRPSGTCLASRIPFSEQITLKKLRKAELTERILKDFFGHTVLLRGRQHKDILRIEIDKSVWTHLENSDINKLVKKLKNVGYKFITLDLEGYIPAGKR
ncbi:MAG: ATP-dependent sacrificial sulfur transferase LarE [Candidatus Omnitrophota bacterium]|nr:MAG: ATP-dependent sacrificial sulfur transferase LarE [Candidatus Omnitrophota bacterium]